MPAVWKAPSKVSLRVQRDLEKHVCSGRAHPASNVCGHVCECAHLLMLWEASGKLLYIISLFFLMTKLHVVYMEEKTGARRG